MRRLATLVALAATACGAPEALPEAPALEITEVLAGDSTGFARADAPRDFSFPRDHGSHPDFRTEWWYYTGHLQGDGGEWGFELALFQQDMSYLLPGYTDMGYMCHVAITDKVGANHVHARTINLESDTWSSDPIVLEVDNCHVEMGGDGRDRIRGVVTDMAGVQGPAGQWTFDVEVEPVKPVPWESNLWLLQHCKPACCGSIHICHH